MNKNAATLTGSSAGSTTSKFEASTSAPGGQIKIDKRVPEDAIRLRAYQKWESAGKPMGDTEQHSYERTTR
jgi:hypothetical protein